MSILADGAIVSLRRGNRCVVRKQRRCVRARSRRRDVGGVKEAILLVRALEDKRGILRELTPPLPRQHAEDAECSPSAKPVLGNLFQVPDAVGYITPSTFLRKVEEMNCAGAVSHVHSNVADLPQIVSFLVKPHQF